MAGNDQDQSADKIHDPTPKKRQDARKKGDVPRSQDVYTAVAYASTIGGAIALGGWAMMGIGNVGIGLLQASGTARLGGAVLPEQALFRTLTLLIPIIGIPAILVLAAAAVQGHLLPVGSKLQPKLSRISIIANAGNKFGPSGLVEFLKSSTKLTMACGVLTYVTLGNTDEIMGAMVLSPGIAVLLMLSLAKEFMIAILILTLGIAAADYAWQAANWTRKNRMSHQDMKDEHKEMEGDPEFKSKRRQKAQEVASGSLVQKIKSADVVIVNPEHFAVALKWDRRQQAAPEVVAKGVDAIALQIRALCTEHGVPIHSDPPTARALHAALNIGDEIHADHYRPVAAAIRFADALRAEKAIQQRWME